MHLTFSIGNKKITTTFFHFSVVSMKFINKKNSEQDNKPLMIMSVFMFYIVTIVTSAMVTFKNQFAEV